MVRFVADVPLRVKLIAAMLSLVTMGLVVIGVATALVTRESLYKRADDQLRYVIASISEVFKKVAADPLPAARTDAYLVASATMILAISDEPNIDELVFLESTVPSDRAVDTLPALPIGDDLQRHIREDKPYTVKARKSMERWRALAVRLDNGQVVFAAESLADIDSTIDHLIAVELLIGAGVLIVLAGVGVAIVQASLSPLRGIERTAAAIAAGDLSRRVPETPTETEIGRLAHALNAMLAQIEWAFRARAASEERMRQFVADASHELRTPLTTIRGFAELYRQGAVRDEEGTAALVKRIEDEASRMGLLVEDLLLLARLDQERPLTFAPLDLRVIVNDAAEAARVVAQDRTVTLEVTPDEPTVVSGDEPRLRQVVGNLVTNALTHTPPGTPVAIRLRRDGTTALIEVADSGPGLSEEQARRVFERFYRVDKARTRKAAGSSETVTPHSGSGLGLAIVAALVAVHTGTVSVHDTLGGGATFQVRLPLTAGSQTESSPPEVDLGTV